jgi:hypothetical protein
MIAFLCVGPAGWKSSLRQNGQYCDHRSLTYADWQAWWYDANYDPPTTIH